MDRAMIEGILGRPHGSMSIPEDDGLVEVLNYPLDDKGTSVGAPGKRQSCFGEDV
jgi:hypothetical protein